MLFNRQYGNVVYERRVLFKLLISLRIIYNIRFSVSLTYLAYTSFAGIIYIFRKIHTNKMQNRKNVIMNSVSSFVKDNLVTERLLMWYKMTCLRNHRHRHSGRRSNKTLQSQFNVVQ